MLFNIIGIAVWGAMFGIEFALSVKDGWTTGRVIWVIVDLGFIALNASYVYAGSH